MNGEDATGDTLKIMQLREENERLKRIIATAYGKDAESFDWSVLGEIDRLEAEKDAYAYAVDGLDKEVEKLEAALKQVRQTAVQLRNKYTHWVSLPILEIQEIAEKALNGGEQ